jgi:hypothetical protein
MGGEGTKVLNLLLAVQHLPALDTEHLAIGLEADEVQALQEGVPLG